MGAEGRTRFPSFDGQAHRLIDLRRTSSDVFTAWLIDDFHHFGVQITHDHKKIIDLSVRAQRFPYSSCAGAVNPAIEYIGALLPSRASEVGKWMSMRHQCTHIYDLLGLAAVHAAKAGPNCHYLTTIDDRSVVKVHRSGKRVLGTGRAVLSKNGAEVLTWIIDGNKVVSPHEWQSQSLGKGFRDRTESMPIEIAEYANILRRAIMVAGGRSADRDAALLPRDNKKPALCFTYQPPQRSTAEWIPSSLRDWSGSEDGRLIVSDASFTKWVD
jgi:hypothetical protein